MRTALIILGLAGLVACDFGDDKKDGKAANHSLAFIGDQGVAEGGKGNIELQLKLGDEAVTDAEGTEVTLTVVCGENSQAFKGKLDKNGKAEVEVDVSDKKEAWGINDWGACKVSADVKVNDEAISATEVELKTVGQEQGTTENETCVEGQPCEEDSYQIGEEIAMQSSLGGGTLSLHDCTEATLYTVSATSVAKAESDTVSADAAGSFPAMFVLGTPGDKCMLQHSPDSSTTPTDHVQIVAAQDKSKEVADLNVTLSKKWQQRAGGCAYQDLSFQLPLRQDSALCISKWRDNLERQDGWLVG